MLNYFGIAVETDVTWTPPRISGRRWRMDGWTDFTRNSPPKIFLTSSHWLKHKERGRGGISEAPPKVRDEMRWQAQVIGLHTFGVLQSNRHPSSHVLECVSFTKYSVCRIPVNAWLFLASARWRALQAGVANMQTYAYGSLDVMHIYINVNLTRKELNLNLMIWCF